MSEHFFGVVSEDCPKPFLAKPKGKFRSCRKKRSEWTSGRISFVTFLRACKEKLTGVQELIPRR
jgi:hypothetical protein